MKGEKALLFHFRELPFAARQYEIQSAYLFPELTARTVPLRPIKAVRLTPLSVLALLEAAEGWQATVG